MTDTGKQACRQCGKPYRDFPGRRAVYREAGLCWECQRRWEEARRATTDPDLMARYVQAWRHPDYLWGWYLSGPPTEEHLRWAVEQYERHLAQYPGLRAAAAPYLPELAVPGRRYRVAALPPAPPLRLRRIR